MLFKFFKQDKAIYRQLGWFNEGQNLASSLWAGPGSSVHFLSKETKPLYLGAETSIQSFYPETKILAFSLSHKNAPSRTSLVVKHRRSLSEATPIWAPSSAAIPLPLCERLLLLLPGGIACVSHQVRQIISLCLWNCECDPDFIQKARYKELSSLWEALSMTVTKQYKVGSQLKGWRHLAQFPLTGMSNYKR